jgi:hypothetical protein
MSFDELLENSAPLFTTGLGKDVLYIPIGGVRKTIKGIFDPERFETDPYGPDTINIPAQVVCQTSDIPTARHKAQVKVGGAIYEIVDKEPDGHGMTTLFLNRKI